MPRSKILATYDSARLMGVVDEAILAGKHGMDFATAKQANNFMLDFYGFRNAMYRLIEKGNRPDLAGMWDLVSRISVSKKQNRLVFTDRESLAEYKAKSTEMKDALAMVEFPSPPSSDDVYKRLGYSTEQPPSEASPAETTAKTTKINEPTTKINEPILPTRIKK